MNWHENRKHISGLWPHWTPTPAQESLWNDSLSGYRQTWLRTAIDEHARLDGPKEGPFIEPRLSRIVSRYAAIAESGEVREGPVSGRRYRATWTQEIHGKPYAMSSRDTFASAREAELYAAERGTYPGSWTVGGTDRSDGYADARADEHEARKALTACDRQTLADLVGRMRDVGLLSDKPIPGKVYDWPRHVAMLVEAALSMGLRGRRIASKRLGGAWADDEASDAATQQARS